MGTFDVDALLAQKDEASRAPKTLTWRGRDWELPPALPLEAADLLARGRYLDVLLMLVGPDQTPAFRAQRPTMDDAEAIIDHAVPVLYGITSGESSASSDSSESTGERPRPTSDASTASTSPEPAGALPTPA